jgi:hypothetical protein
LLSDVEDLDHLCFNTLLPINGLMFNAMLVTVPMGNDAAATRAVAKRVVGAATVGVDAAAT